MGGMRSFGLRSAMFLAMTAAPVLGATTPAPASSFTGNFANDADQKEFFFSLATAGPITVRTLSYAGGTNGAGNSVPPGGFDTTLSLYDSTGALIAVNQDGGCALVATDPVTGSCWDAYLSVSLPAGTYRVVLTQSLNMPAGTTLADSFLFNPNNLFNNSDTVNGTAVPPLGGQTGFTAPPGQSGSFWDFFPNQRTSFYAIDIAGATTAVAPAVSSSSTLQFGIVGTAYSLALGVQSGAGVT